MQKNSETIFALATPLPPRSGSGIAIIRLSGPESFDIAKKICTLDFAKIQPRTFQLAVISDSGNPIDQCGIIAFHAPASYTGEDVVEFHLHGGIGIIKSVTSLLISKGGRPAEPGEFTRRAFLNGRLDLVQAEAVASIVSSEGAAANREGFRQRSGELSKKIKSIRESLRNLLGKIEVVFDYPEEVEDMVDGMSAVIELDKLIALLRPLAESYQIGKLLKGFRIAIIGRPNVGKSSLLNALLREDRAIVTPIPGTTRDVVSATVEIGGVPVEVLDTAGIRPTTDIFDVAEKEGINRSWKEVERAHIVLIVLDMNDPISELDMALVEETHSRLLHSGGKSIYVCNKLDLPPRWNLNAMDDFMKDTDIVHVNVSAKKDIGIDDLKKLIIETLDLHHDSSELLLTESRHHSLIQEAMKIIMNVSEGIKSGIPQDVAATELWGADRALGMILGENVNANDLDEIFSHFCIGK